MGWCAYPLEPLRIATNLLDVPAEIIALLHEYRWTIEIFFLSGGFAPHPPECSRYHESLDQTPGSRAVPNRIGSGVEFSQFGRVIAWMSMWPVIRPNWENSTPDP
jgi:hypothetical protein